MLKLVAVLLSVLTFTACEKEEFTAEDALALELQRLTAEQNHELAVLAQEQAANESRMLLQREIDRLNQMDAGGIVYYSVAVVPGGQSVFSGGRAEDAQGVAGATVTIGWSPLGSDTEIGGVFQATTDESGIAVFPDLRSGEVTVNITIDGFTDMSYVANLTPDGGVANGSTIFVGNVVPVFENDPATADPNDMATISGRGYAELDITFGNDTEEELNAANLAAANVAVTPTLASYINPNADFWAEYIAEANEEGQDAFPGSTGSTSRKSGYIQRISYEEAAVVTEYDGATANYSMMVPATGSGLQTIMQFSQFAADRTYFDTDNFFDGVLGGPTAGDADFGIVSKRFLYGTPNTTAIPAVGVSNFTDRNIPVFSLVDQEASVSISISNVGSVTGISLNASSTSPSGSGSDDGLYLIAPTVTVAAPAAGTQAVATAVLDSKLGVVGSADYGDLRVVDAISIPTGGNGAGYTSAPAVTITRQSSGVTGNVRQEAATGGLSNTARVIDGGFGFTAANANPAPGTTFTGAGTWTGLDPILDLPQNFTGTAPTLDFVYDFEVSNNTDFPIVSRIDMTTTGTDWDQSELDDLNANPFIYTALSLAVPNSDQDGDALFVTTGAANALAWNPDYGDDGTARTIGALGLDASGALDITTAGNLLVDGLSRGSGYVFVPGLTIQGGNGTGATVDAVVDVNGVVITLILAGGSGYTSPANSSITVSDPSNDLDAEFFLGGSGIQAYEVTNSTGNAGYLSGVAATAGGSFQEDAETNVDRFDDVAPTINSLVALASVPTGAGGGTEASRAYGYPVFNSAQTQVIGIELFDGGVGYEGDATWELVPVYGAATGGNVDASASATISSNLLVVTLDQGGSGYAHAPELHVTGGGVLLGDPLAPEPSDFSFEIDANGTITDVVNGYNARVGASFPYEAGAVPTGVVTIADKEDAMNTLVADDVRGASLLATGGIFPPGLFPVLIDNYNADGTLAGYVLDDFFGSTDLDDYFNSTTTDFFSGRRIGLLSRLEDDGDFADYVGVNATTGNSVIPHNAFVTAPNVTLVSDFGFGAGATAEVVLDQFDGRIVDLTITNGGAGYVFSIETNSEYIDPAGEPFRVLGGSTAWEVYSGIQYVRDVHYGTGEELE